MPYVKKRGDEGKMILCDTNIIIELLKGSEKTIGIVNKIGIEELTISSITEMELYYGAFNKREIQFIKKHLSSLPIIHVTKEISMRSVNLIEQFSKSHKLSIPDAFIAATALEFHYELLTYNLKDFKFIPGLRLHKI